MEKFKEDGETYGSHNCHVNALDVMMKRYNIDTSLLYRYNFNINMAEDHHHFGGNVPYLDIIDFIEKIYGLEIIKCDMYDIPTEQLVILPLDSFWLPYIENRSEINIGEQLHYVLAEILVDGKVSTYDPYYKMYHQFERDEIVDSWRVFTQPIVYLKNTQNEKIENEKIFPYLLNVDYKTKYKNFIEELKKVFITLEEKGFDNNELFKRFFSCVKSILIIRKKHFEVSNNSIEIAEKITDSWASLIKEMCRLSVKNDNNLERLYGIISKTMELEIDYLKQMEKCI